MVFCFSCPCKILEVFSLLIYGPRYFFLLLLPRCNSISSKFCCRTLWLVVWKFLKNDHWPLWKFLWIWKKKVWMVESCLSHGKLITFYYPIDHLLFKLICTVCVHTQTHLSIVDKWISIVKDFFRLKKKMFIKILFSKSNSAYKNSLALEAFVSSLLWKHNVGLVLFSR